MFGETKKKDEEGEEEEEEKEAGEAGAALGPGEVSGGVGELKGGDYMVHVFIEKAKEILLPDGRTVDPIIVIECLGKKEYSTAKDDIGGAGEVTWNEHLFLEAKKVEKETAECGKILIKLMDKGIFKDVLIGEFEFDLSFIYFMKDHVMLHKWLALSNPHGGNFEAIAAYLKVSISVSCQGDEQTQINEDLGDEDTNVMMSPALNPKYYQIKIRIFQGQDLPAMDSAVGFIGKDKIDAYMYCEFKGRKYKTKVITQNKGGPPVDWNEEFWLPAQIPVATPKILVQLKDRDDLGTDEVAGSILFDTKKVIQGEQNGMFIWKNIYGSPLNQKNSKYKREMNKNPDVASSWKGRVLCQIVAEPTEKPVSKQQKIEQEVIIEAKPAVENKKYAVIAEIGQAVALPSNNKFMIKITFGGYVIEFKPFDQRNPSNYKRYDRCEQKEIDAPFVDACDFGYMIIQLYDGHYPICYYIDHISNYLNPNPQFKWVSFLPDQCVGKVRNSHKTGMVSFKFSIHDLSKNGPIDFKTFKAWKGKVAKRSNPVKIRAYIYQCQDLPAADAEGTSDPYIVAWDTVDKVKKTKVVDDNCNPLFYETLELEYEVNEVDNLESFPPFILDVYDFDDDLFDKEPDFLGRAIIEPEDCSIVVQKAFEKCEQHRQKNCDLCADLMAEVPQVPRWHHIHYAPGEPICGKILVSFAVVDHDYTFNTTRQNVDLSKRIEMKEFSINMLILGMRNLQSPGILPVKKAFVKFNIKSLVPPNGPALKNIQTQPIAPGANPTLNTAMKFQIPLPTDDLYCPKLSCTVYDYIFKGWNQPIIGVFALPIGQLMLDLIAERQEETSIMLDIEEKLDIIIRDAQPQIQKNLVNSVNESLADETEALSISNYSGENINSLIDIENQQKGIAKQRKKAKKQAKEMGTDFTEQFGASEEAGNTAAQESRDKQIQLARDAKKKLLNYHNDALQSTRKTGAQIFTSQVNSDPYMSGVNKNDAMRELSEARELQKRLEEDERIRMSEELNKKGDDAHKVVLMPKYKMDERLKIYREVDVPPSIMFIGLGWDEDNNTKRRHYRQFYPDELEHKKDIFPTESPFNSYSIYHGVAKGDNDKPKMFSNKVINKESKEGEAESDHTQQVVGIFKSIVQVESKDGRDAYQVKKKKIIDKLKFNINTLSLKVLNKPYVIDTDKLGDPMERHKFEMYNRQLGIDHLNISQHLCNLESDQILKRSLMTETRCMIRVYMVSAFNLSSRDNGSSSDPYLSLSCNGKTFKNRDQYQLNEPNPDFHLKYEFEGKFPGSTPLKVEVWDYDMIFGDDLIGITYVDLEDRYFNMEWQALVEKPIEYRQIYHPSSAIDQGTLKMWVEINPVSAPPDSITEYDIRPKPVVELEVRVAILNCKEIPMMDMEGTCDAFCRGFFDSKEDVQETDTHFRNQDGKPDFQYRLIYNVKYPRKDYKYHIQAYDLDFFTGNELIGESVIDLAQIMEDCTLVKSPVNLSKKYYEEVLKVSNPNLKMDFDKSDETKIWLPLISKKDGKTITNGFVRVQIDIFPKLHAEKNPVGKARDSPNHSPQLPQPEGRMEMTFNPIKMFNQLIGPALRTKIKLYIVLFLCCALFVAILPNIVGGLITSLITG